MSMFERFQRSFIQTDRSPSAPWIDARLESATGYREFATAFAGCSFNDGLFRVHDAETGPGAQAAVADAFPEFAERATPFAFDWMGQQFAVDDERLVGGEPQILLIEPGTGEVLEIPCAFVEFHNVELVEHRDAALSSSFFEAWVQANPDHLPLPAAACVGYRVPLFFGGSDEITNLALVGIDAYWQICAELLRAVAGLAPGLSVDQVVISEQS